MEATLSQALIVQGDGSVLLDVHAPDAEAARNAIAPFAELVKSPEHIHTYKVSSLSLWNAASVGFSAQDVLKALEDHARFPIPQNVAQTVTDTMSRYGVVRLRGSDDAYRLQLEVSDPEVHREITAREGVMKYLEVQSDDTLWIDLVHRGTVKQELMKIGYPVDDLAPLNSGESLKISFRDHTAEQRPFNLRDYQREAAEAFYAKGRLGAGFGTVVLPCGSGKTVIGMAVMEMAKTNTLILTTNVAAVHQWIDELLDKTDIDPEAIGEYTGHRKEVKPITIATYQILVWRPAKGEVFPHFDIFRKRQWGLIIYDEVHLLPAPVFRVTAEIQAVRRLGLTATLVREDGRAEDVFSLVGPKRYDVPWKELEQKGWIAEALCREIRIDLPRDLRREYSVADARRKFRLASENPAKTEIVVNLVQNHHEDLILVIGQYLNQLHDIAKELDAPIITGKTPNAKREEIYAAFRKHELSVIVVSKVANFAIDLPDASVAIQVSGSFGSRQEEAQRLGRILRPKKHRNSYFYTLVSNRTVEEQFSANRQKFLTEQGYSYHIEHWEENG